MRGGPERERERGESQNGEKRRLGRASAKSTTMRLPAPPFHSSPFLPLRRQTTFLAVISQGIIVAYFISFSFSLSISNPSLHDFILNDFDFRFTVKIVFSCRSSFLLLLLVLFERLLPLGLMPFCLKLTGLYIVFVDSLFTFFRCF